MVDALGPLSKEELPFVETPEKKRQSMTLDGPTLGVLPDYGFEGVGMRIIGTNPGQPAQNAGLQSGDIILALGETPFEDIYQATKNLIVGQTTITIVRDGTNNPRPSTLILCLHNMPTYTYKREDGTTNLQQKLVQTY